jgi:hypothetical protein
LLVMTDTPNPSDAPPAAAQSERRAGRPALSPLASSGKLRGNEAYAVVLSARRIPA